MDYCKLLKKLDRQTPEYLRGEHLKPGENVRLKLAIDILQEMAPEKKSVRVVIVILRIRK